ncbi:NXPE family member 3-like [Rhinophrynus dorsalis]
MDPGETLLPPHFKVYPWLQATPLPKSSLDPQDQELQALLKVIEWPEPLGPTDFESSTSPQTTDYHLLLPRDTYYVGDRVDVLIIARDHRGLPKSYGGDYFQAKLHSPKLKAGVTGSVTDHRNGSYTASFLLLWPGQAEISIQLVHSSEAIAILRQKRDKGYIYGYFYENNSMEVTECNVEPPGPDVCEYPDKATGQSWFCVRPKHLPCSAYTERLEAKDLTRSPLELRFLNKSVTEKLISSTLKPLLVLPQNRSTDNRGICVPGLQNPDPSGFYYQDVWQSRVCRNRHFPKPSNITECLSGKILYMFGDSTTHQWWRYLVGFIPSLQHIDLHIIPPGPELAIDTTYNFAVQWQMHQGPLTMTHSAIPELRYTVNELDRIGGGKKGLVIVINCLAHFILLPVRIYVHRLRGIRGAVVRLLKRSPQTNVLIKSGNTGYMHIHASDWLSLQLDLVMRAMFSGLPVTILDTWQMTSCHYLPQDLHPGRVIVMNEVDLMLSFICPE